MAEQRRHLAHHRQTGRGLQPLLLSAVEFFDAALLAQVEHRTHPAGLSSLRIDQRRFDDEHRKVRAIAAQEHRLKALAWQSLPSQTHRLALLVHVEQFGGPIRGGQARAQKLRWCPSHHVTKRGVDVSQSALHVACAQPGDERVFHRFAKGQGIGQLALGAPAPTHVARQEHQHHQQRQRQRPHHGGEHIGKQTQSAPGALQLQLQGVPGQIQQSRGLHQIAPAGYGRVQTQPGAIAFSERQATATDHGALDPFGHHRRQAVSGDQKTLGHPRLRDGQTHLHQLQPATARDRPKVVAGKTRAAAASGRITRAPNVGQGLVPRQGLKHIAQVGRVARHEQGHVGVAPLQTNKLSMTLQHTLGALRPQRHVGIGSVQELQHLGVSGQLAAHVVGQGFDVARQSILLARPFVLASQKHQHTQQARQQHQEQKPHQPPAPGVAPSALQGGGSRHHKRRCCRAGSWLRTERKRVRSISARAKPGPSACTAKTSPHGSITMLWPQVRRPLS